MTAAPGSNAKFRSALPQLDSGMFITDGGLETTLVFLEGVELFAFAAFPLVLTEEGRGHLIRYFTPYLETARQHGTGFILDTPTWRANRDWGQQLGYGPEDLAAVNRKSVEFIRELRDAVAAGQIVLNGVIGPRGDGYAIDTKMTPEEAADYHGEQIDVFSGTAADMVTAVTMTYAEEATGIALAARRRNMPVAISFTVETDGLLPSGQSLADAIAQTDDATERYPAYYMINCAHPRHFDHVLGADEPWTRRLHGLRANASTKSHAELDAATELDSGDPAALGRYYRALIVKLPTLRVLGGCCGTDHRHIRAICEACA
jgi:S-methylmethionine-dependent homocysteine/selenocysteine methylase